jgi:hypothetical protein
MSAAASRRLDLWRLGGHRRHLQQQCRVQMSTRNKPSPTRAKTRTKRKPAKSASMTKALVNKADHVKRQLLKSRPQVRALAGASSSNRKPGARGTGKTRDVARTAENSQPALTGSMHALAFWSPVAVLLRQQALFASMALNVIQSQRLWVQSFGRAA